MKRETTYGVIALLMLLTGCGGGSTSSTADPNDSNLPQPDDFNATEITTFDQAVSAYLATKEYVWNGKFDTMSVLSSGSYAPLYWTMIAGMQFLAVDTDKLCSGGGDVSLYRTDRPDGEIDMKLSFANCRIQIEKGTNVQLFGNIVLNGLDENLSLQNLTASEYDQFSASFTDDNWMLTGQRIELDGSLQSDWMFKGSFTRYTALGKGVHYTRIETENIASFSFQTAVEHFPDPCARDGRYRFTYNDIDASEFAEDYLFSKGSEIINGVEYRFFSSGTTYSVGITLEDGRYRVFDQKTLSDGCDSIIIDLPEDLNIDVDLPHQITFQ